MKIKHLVDLFYHKLNGPDDATAEDAMRVVVTALRDELGDPSTFKSAKQECCGRGVPNHSNTAEECCCLPDTWLLHEEFLGRINEILAPREGGATTDAIQSFEGDESDGHFSEGISRTERAGKAAVGAPERSGSGTAQHDHDRREKPRDVAGSHETGRGRDVGGQVNHGVSRGGQAAGGPRPEAVGSTPPAAPAPAVCEWRDIFMTSEYLAKCGWRQSNIDYRTNCPSCGKPIKFTEAK